MYLVSFYFPDGSNTFVCLDHFPTSNDVPPGVVRMDVAIPYNAEVPA